jgi:hypothetical protein
MSRIRLSSTYSFNNILKTPLAQGVFIFLAIVISLVALIETTARLLVIPAPFPSLGSDNFYFDYKIYTIESMERHEGQPNCLIAGSSVAHFNMDAAALEQAYAQSGGQTLRCFNIGIPALTVETAVPVLEALIRRYHPQVVLYIVMPRDLMEHEFSVRQLAQNPWVTYHNQHITPYNWLIVHSYSLRYLTTWQYWLTPSNRPKMAQDTEKIDPATRGFSGREGVNQAAPANWLIENDAKFYDLWSNQQNLENIDRLIAFQQEYQTKIVFIEAPAYSIVHLQRDNPDIQGYEQGFIAPLQSHLQAQHVPFWRILEIGRQIPDSGWFDWLHLNNEGAQRFSRWVGEQLAQTPELFR